MIDWSVYNSQEDEVEEEEFQAALCCGTVLMKTSSVNIIIVRL